MGRIIAARGQSGVLMTNGQLEMHQWLRGVGCKSCITACPWGAPQWNPETGKVVKCDYCMDRVDQGLEPACVSKCVTHCLSFGRVEQMDLTKRERFARTVAFELETIVSAR